MDVTPYQAMGAARALDPARKRSSTIPKNVPAPPGTGSFGRFVHEVGYITQLFFDNCTVDPWILAVSSVNALLRASYDVFSWDPKEGFHKVTGKSVVCTLKGEIHERGTFERWGYDGLKNTLFRTAEVADLAVWQLFLAAVLADGLKDWETVAQRMSGCDDRGPFSSHEAQGSIGDSTNPNGGNGFEWLTGDPRKPAFTPNIELLPGQQGHILWQAQGTFDGINAVPVTSWIEEEGTGFEMPGTRKESVVEFTSTGMIVHPIISHFRYQNSGVGIRTFKQRAHAMVPGPSGNCFFLKGFCAISPGK